MKCVTWTKDSGRCTVAVLFANGYSAAESVAEFEPEEAKAAIKWLKAFCGPDYSKNNIPWAVTDAKTGITRQIFRRRNLVGLGG